MNIPEQGPAQRRLLGIYKKASGPASLHLREQLAYRHMLALAETFEGWALDERLTPEETARLVGFSESMRALADDVGLNWNPPRPEELTLMGFLGRKILDEE